MFSKPDSALVIVGHGSTINPDSSAPTYEHAEAIARGGAFGEVLCAFWKEEPSLRQVLHMIDRDDIYVVPNFISEGYFTRTIIPRELGLAGAITRQGSRTIKYCDPVGNHERMTEVLLHRAAEIAPGVPPAETSLFIVGHGTDLNDNSATAAKRETQRIRERGSYAEVRNAYMEEEPLISEWEASSTRPNVVVVPFFIADGLHSYEDIPVLLGIREKSRGAASADAQEVFRRNPYRLRGRTLYYASAIGTEPLFAEVILDQVAAFDAQHAASVVLAA
ncbi:MAG: cobalamin biosynthesis protein CbiX [Verrucomicrobiota bacterium]|nr:cobalamin biosynthesis protein CbiX [Verrucomicrobiota bacterium]